MTLPRLRLVKGDPAPPVLPDPSAVEGIVVGAGAVPNESLEPLLAVPDGDAEIESVEGAVEGGSADGVPMGFAATWADLTSNTDGKRAPIVPPWVRNPQTRRKTLEHLIGNLWYLTRWHAARSPKYAAKVAVYAPLGALRTGGRVARWASAEQGNFELRQHAARTNNALMFQSLDKLRAKESKGRWWAVAAGAVAVVVVTTVVGRFIPGWLQMLAGVGATGAAARAGRPADRPITDRTVTGPRFTRLSAEMVRNALIALRIAGMKDPAAIEFVHPGVHRDGPGWLARVNLPEGLEAISVLELRGGLSSALRLPVDQVWPAAGPDHAGQLDLWVGYQPASTMGQPLWSLVSPNAVTTVFDEWEFGTDERQRPVLTSLFARSFIIAGQPGSGKTYAGRTIITIAALDPTAELKIAEFKGTGDFLDMQPLCSTYECGVDETTLAAGAAILRWGVLEAERRGKRILRYKKLGMAPHGKVTPELAQLPGSGLHPVVIAIDECHELFAEDPQAAKDAERLIKRARALNIIIVLMTQIPDKSSLPPNIVRCVTNRWCLSVAGQVENDMVLGTGSYKRGVTGTVYRPVLDAGWGVMTGGAAPVSVRSHFASPEDTAAIVAHALAMRGGRAVGVVEDLPAARDLLADLVEVSASNGRHWGPAAATMTDSWPNAYPGLTGDALSELARAAGVPSVDVKIERRTLKGYRLDVVRQLLAARAADPGEVAAEVAAGAEVAPALPAPLPADLPLTCTDDER